MCISVLTRIFLTILARPTAACTLLRELSTLAVEHKCAHCCCLASAEVKYNLDGVSRLEGVMGCFNALGTVAFAYGGHNVVLEIQASMI